MKTEISGRSASRARVLFCMVLVLALLAAMFSLNGLAEGAAPVTYDVKVESCSTHTAALSGGKLYVWGVNDHGQLPASKLTHAAEPVKALSGVEDVAVSFGRTLVVDKKGVLTLYGRDLIDLDKKHTSGKQLAKDVASVAVGDDFALYVTKSGALYSLGSNQHGQLGDGGNENSAEPVLIMESGVSKVDAGSAFGLALTDEGKLYAWGDDTFLQYGQEKGGKPVSYSEPTLIMEDVQDISAGELSTCAIQKNGDLWTCGNNSLGEAGQGPDVMQATFNKVLSGIVQVSCGNSHALAVGSDGKVYGWGSAIKGELGSSLNSYVFEPEETGLSYAQVFCGDNCSFGLDKNGAVDSFGSSFNFKLGKLTSPTSLNPERIFDEKMNWVYEKPSEVGPSDFHTHGFDNSVTDGSSENGGSQTDDVQLKSLPFISGNGDGTFRPNANITRAEFLKMVVVGLGSFDSGKTYGAPSYTDVAGSEWYAPYVAYAEENKLIKGDGDGLFRPNDVITRAEAATMAANAMKLELGSVEDTVSSFDDVEGWAVPYVEAMVKTGAIVGYDGLFRPSDNLTRAEGVKIVAAASGFEVTPEAKAEAETIANPFTDVPTNQWYYLYILRGFGLLA